MHRTPAQARIQASNLLFHIERRLEQGMMHQPAAYAVGTADSKVVVLTGHDTNIAPVAALLGRNCAPGEIFGELPMRPSTRTTSSRQNPTNSSIHGGLSCRAHSLVHEQVHFS
jgi:hypothetical protein